MNRIFAFINGTFGLNDVAVIAMAADGTCLASHISSGEGWAKHDIGIGSDWKHSKYDAHFGAGNWEIEWVPAKDIGTHEGLQAALAIANAQSEATESP